MEKLVRDNVPKIMREAGATPHCRYARSDEMFKLLLNKAHEELDELQDEPTLEELADVAEVVTSLCNFLGFTVDALETERKRKAGVRGGFSAGIVLDISNSEAR
jgi:predicted house-cleaning noncanonical NTP pyrophosphatase (MazG superfamily)